MSAPTPGRSIAVAPASSRAISEADRLALVEATGLTGVQHEEAFDRATRIVALATGAPIAYVSLVTASRQCFVGACAADPAFATLRGTPISQSLCRHVIEREDGLVLDDVARHPDFASHPAVSELGIRAYLGMPLRLATGAVLGSLCVMDTAPRCWSERDAAIVREVAAGVGVELGMRIGYRAELAERLHAATMEERQAAAAALIVGLRHEINNALSGLLLEAELLQLDDSASPEQRESVAAMQAQGRRIAEAVTRLQDVRNLPVTRTPEGDSAVWVGDPAKAFPIPAPAPARDR